MKEKNALASRMTNLGTESAFGVLARANELEAAGRSVIHCEIGQPDFKTPAHIIEAAYQAMKDGYTGYGPTPGYPQLRERIAAYYREQKGVPAQMDQVVVVPGGKPVMFFSMLMLIEPGDEVIVPDPGFPIYQSCVRFVGGKVVPLPLTAENRFCFTPEGLRAAITPKTKLVILNSPSNPTGGVCTAEDLKGLAEVLAERPDIYILADEIYDRLVYGMDIAPSIAALPGFQDRTIILNGFSKSYSMTGWRLGYGIMRRDLAEQMELLMVNSNSCAASFTQMAALTALDGPQDSVLEMKAAFQERRDWLVEALNQIPGIRCEKPQGAFYAFPDISSFGLSSHDFCVRLLDEAGVATTWGTSFGAAGEGFMRLSYATSLDNLKEAVRRLEAFTVAL